MKKKIIIPILIIFTIAYIVANLIYSNYQKEITKDYNIYYLERSILIDNESKIKKVGTNNKTVYVGLTTNYSNALKIQKMYKDSNINVLIKEEKITDADLVCEISQYDILIASTDDFEQISNILDTIMATFEENLKKI